MKRRLFKLILFLLLGAIVNVAVAWGCSYWTDRSIETLGTDEQLPFHWKDEEVIFWGRTYVRPGRIVVHHDQTNNWYPPSEWRWPTTNTRPPAWSVASTVYSYPQTLEKDLDQGQLPLLELAFGWPSCAMYYRCELSSNYAIARIRNGLDYSPEGYSLLKSSELPHVWPLRPIWRGFVANALLYGFVLWALNFGASTARRMIRRKRGHCTKCGYDLRGAEHEVCPECGADGSL